MSAGTIEAMRLVDVSIIVIAKEPVPGRVKTRLCPPCSPAQAADLARAALADTLAAANAAPVGRRILALEGTPGEWVPDRWEVIEQRGDGLDERLAAAFDDVGGPALLIGMDTPQLTGPLLAAAASAFVRPGCDAVLGPTFDGGYWAIGLRTPCAEALVGVPMSCEDTCAHQHARLLRRGLDIASLQVLRDVDTFDDAQLVAAERPESRFARALDQVNTAATAA